MSGKTKTPVLRFPDALPCEEKQLDKVVSFKKGKGYSKADLTESGTPVFLYGRMYTDYRFSVDGVDTFADLRSDSVLSTGAEVVVPASGETAEDIARATAIKASGIILGGDLNVLTPLVPEKTDTSVLALALSNGTPSFEIATRAQGGTISHVHKDDLEDVLVSLPSSPTEQQSIGGFFRELDALIAEREKALGKLESLKKAMLEKMFPQGDAKVPEVRFKGFEGEWEEKKLGECGSCQSGEGFPEIEQGGKTGIPFFKVSDMNLPGNESELIRANNYVTEEQIRKCLWHPVEVLPAVFFAKVGAAVMLNRKRLVKNRFLLDNNTMAFRLKTCIYPDFAKVLFDTIDLPALSQTGALPSIGAGNVEELQRRIPSIPEQQAIGSFFRSLDALLAARREEAEKLKQLKKAFLERMFA